MLTNASIPIEDVSCKAAFVPSTEKQTTSSHPTGTTTATTTTATNGGGDNYHFKTLVPSVAAGAIIGKGGETIASLQKDAGARVKMSKAHDFYPACPRYWCPITTPGLITGKAGAYIKQIKEESGSYVQISQKPKDLTLQERCITIIGEKENNRIACKMILAKIVEDPSSGTCLNVSYADINGPVANFNPTGSPFAASQNPNFSSSTASLNSAISGPLPNAAATGLLVNGTGLNLSLNLGPAGRSLVEIQHISGANIQISKKGIFAPGTRNRIVTITGQQNAINVAQYLIEERISQEETKRACQTAANAAATNKTSAASVATVTQ
uniref:K Homology domain-containing protein n=1 Tax=Anopheles coluzzii TaxID=1518534 RepID=A0A8W7PTP3_ANOCL